MTLEELIEDGYTLVARYVITGTQQKAFMDVASVKQRIELPAMSILHFRNGRCFERWTYSDSLLLLEQIGETAASIP